MIARRACCVVGVHTRLGSRLLVLVWAGRGLVVSNCVRACDAPAQCRVYRGTVRGEHVVWVWARRRSRCGRCGASTAPVPIELSVNGEVRWRRGGLLGVGGGRGHGEVLDPRFAG